MSNYPPIFISYRRSDLSLEAEWIYNLIRKFFGEHIAFLGDKEMVSGKRWDEILSTSVPSAEMVLVLIGPRWLREQEESGKRRLDVEEDWVRQEVIAAMKTHRERNGKTRVIPVLLNGTALPKQEWLPKEMSALALFQTEKAFEFDIRNYLEAASPIYEFLKCRLMELKEDGSISPLTIKPFDADDVPNPYEISGYQLPRELKKKRPEFPFKGLEYFKKEDARIFFGRQTEIGEIIDSFKKSQNILRLHGQSGVGKSSLLFAGLYPRLEANGWTIKYFRRDPGILLGQSLKAIIDELDRSHGADALIILDQVEEIITNPNHETQEKELKNLAEVISELGKINLERKKPIRLILSYRKEYDVNIKSSLQENGVCSNDHWLKDLSESGMQEAIIGITRDHDLNDAYHLVIEPGLDNLIIDELFNKAKREDTTPLLQILLRKMWDNISESDIDNRIFTRGLYEKCKCTDLVNLLDEQLDIISNKKDKPELRNAVESGLALDVLKCFITEQDTTTDKLTEQRVVQQYDNRAPVKILLQAFVDAYLLMRIDKDHYRLPHDSLAKAVRKKYDRSEFPGQRALRLLERKMQDFKSDSDVEFSKSDLKTIEDGKRGMRKWSSAEIKIVEESKQRIEEHELELEEKKKRLEAALAEANEQTLQAKAKAMAATAREVSQRNPTLGIRLAEASMQITSKPTKESRSAFVDVLSMDKILYKTIFKDSLPVNYVSFSPDGKSILTAGWNGTRIWDLKGTILQVFKEPHIEFATFSPDGKSILVIWTGRDAPACLLDLEGNIIQIFEGHSKSVCSAAFSSDGKFIVTGSLDNTARIWDLKGNTIGVLEGHTDSIDAVAFSPDDKLILTGSSDYTARIWDLYGNTIRILEGHTDSIRSVAFSAKDKIILTGSSDKTVRIWGLNGSTVRILQGHTHGINSVAFSPDGKLIVTGSSDSTARLWNWKDNTNHVLEGHTHEIVSVAFSPNGKSILTGSIDSTARLWDVNAGTLHIFGRNSHNVRSAAFSRNGKLILTGSFDKSAQFWDSETNFIRTIGELPGIVCEIAFSPDDKLILISSSGSASLWNLKDNTFQILQGCSGPNKIAYSNNGKYLLTGGNKTARLWDLKGNTVRIFEGHFIVTSVAFSPDDKLILTGDHDGTRIWDLENNDSPILIHSDAIVRSVAFSPDGRVIVTGSDKVRLWDLKGNLIRILQGKTGHIKSVAFSADGKSILTASFDNTTRIWDIDGNTLQIFKGYVQTASFSSNGRLILTRGNRTAQLFRVYWDHLNPENSAIPTSEERKEYDIPDNIEWGKRW